MDVTQIVIKLRAYTLYRHPITNSYTPTDNIAPLKTYFIKQLERVRCIPQGHYLTTVNTTFQTSYSLWSRVFEKNNCDLIALDMLVIRGDLIWLGWWPPPIIIYFNCKKKGKIKSSLNSQIHLSNTRVIFFLSNLYFFVYFSF